MRMIDRTNKILNRENRTRKKGRDMMRPKNKPSQTKRTKSCIKRGKAQTAGTEGSGKV